MTKFGELIGALAREQVEFIIVGGVAATAHGALRTTLDLDVLYARSGRNLRAIVRALAPLDPYLLGADPGPPSAGLGQLTGHERFVDGVAAVIGRRFEHRQQGRPRMEPEE